MKLASINVHSKLLMYEAVYFWSYSCTDRLHRSLLKICGRKKMFDISWTRFKWIEYVL